MFGQPDQLQAGVLLIANPFLPDPNFRRTVVLLVEHDDQGTLGFVLNKPSDLLLADVLDDMPASPAQHLYIGGPVQLDSLHVVHRAGLRLPGSISLGQGLAWGGDYDQLRAQIRTGEIALDETRFFLGYSGWSAGQLAGELSEKTWMIVEPPADLLTIPADTLWRTILRSMGSEYAIIANFPEDPRMN